jgi:catalase
VTKPHRHAQPLKEHDRSEKKKPQHLTHATGTPVTDNLNILTAGPRGPALLQDL